MRPVARIAQSVEQGIENPRVRGSIPRPGTIHRSTLVRYYDGWLKKVVFTATILVEHQSLQKKGIS